MITKKRATRETDVTLTLELYGSGRAEVDTGVGFFDHMLTAMAFHGGFDLTLLVSGDLAVDCHHTIEDVGLVLGDALREALGDGSGIARYGDSRVPMDEALAETVLDISGRPYLVFDCPFTVPMIGSYDTQMTEEFFRALAVRAGLTLHIRVPYGKNAHHMTEGIYKSFGRALRMAAARSQGGIPSSKGTLL
ncbi:imidazoleglycerol-phosphate dehydratase HisB [Feifania hominis]|uniref:Imidazoleglycerol-phosphate dehydratase n=1 Tax=Feifania hominis TaxID=2763660 RepID=A0A926DF93_9FIRM|nr:imidazoleglycerol-phosphate dehydratase HisB [Feifania hominis]MBC8536204.1 imidazoleglycerol-phosphate dehydratase HisB [Feifania hominis]